ncbi:T9SS type A sorting domain-containing protein [Panacibacter ginsenosidivorans]|uniref:T9SS type A sorting domain-containing protein n=1 Tax=Panacibacter ginsenosidivorans TaxID=1813871 RepID=A0A5B8V6G6_9BACT|nr:T9SS type A sorting domain-containing protein [Panacibacter ginsenosidivorans]QEC66331.1 T9SS type A sorting domain-containing protein [Panacibacter ginsenosidivorans]
MKKFDTKKLLLLLVVFICSYAYTQVSSPVSLQKRLSLKPWQKLPAYNATFNGTLKTKANTAPAASVSDGVDVRIFPSSNVQAEVIIAINKTNPLNLLASANTLLGPLSYSQGYYSSHDGGATWTGADALQNIQAGKIDGDPSVAFSADGTAFLTTIAAGAFGTAGYWFQKSTDGGVNWSAGVKGNSSINFDKEMITSDNTASSPFANNFYCTWTDFNSGNGAVAFNRSVDKGVTFSSKIQLRSGAVGFGQGCNVQTGPNGEVYVCWADHTTVVSPYEADGMGFAKSVDGGVTFTPASVIFPYAGIRVDNTSSRYNFTRVNDFPSMAVDKSRTIRKGRIYITYPEKNATGNSVIKVRFSDNQGTTWSAAKVISIANAREAFFPWITVDDATGIVWVTYYAFDQATGYSTNTYLAGSQNGIKWVNLKVSDVPHITAPIDNNNFALGYAGDYIGVAANGLKAYPTWMDNRNGTWQVYCSPVTVTTAFASDAEPVASANISANKLLVVNPNPVSSFMHLTLKGTEIISAQLFSQSGKLIKQWQNATTDLAVSEVPNGIYFIKVLGKDGKTYTENMVKK